MFIRIIQSKLKLDIFFPPTPISNSGVLKWQSTVQWKYGQKSFRNKNRNYCILFNGMHKTGAFIQSSKSVTMTRK